MRRRLIVAGDSVSSKRILVPFVVLAALAVAGLGFVDSAHAATWCGTPGSADRLPQLTAGYSVHFVYAIPSDGTDRLATVANDMQTDAEEMDAWWRREDPTRTPRLDTYPFPCGPQLDITLVRLPTTGAETEPIFGRARKVIDGLSSADLTDSPYRKLIVYYDGPDMQGDERKICGQGGQLFAIVYLNACTDIPTDDIATHELVHALGAVSPAAPHHCENGHTCDSPLDLMHALADSQNIFARLLDPGRDDYYGHAGGWDDIQNSPWLVHLDAQAQLSISFSGGQGTVTSNIPGVQCTAACTSQWDSGTEVTLAAKPADGQRLVRWSGGCSGSARCTVTVGTAAAVGAIFGPSTFALKVSVGGKGRVRGASNVISCPGRCSGKVSAGVPTVLAARPSNGWRFNRWFGACRGTSPTCVVPMKSDRVARAVFVRVKRQAS